MADTREQYKKEIAACNSIMAQARKLADAKDYPALMGVLRKLREMSYAADATAKLDKEFFLRIDTARTRVAEIEGKMRFWYVVGTGSLLLSSLLASFLLDVTLRRIERQTMQGKIQPTKKQKPTV